MKNHVAAFMFAALLVMAAPAWSEIPLPGQYDRVSHPPSEAPPSEAEIVYNGPSDYPDGWDFANESMRGLRAIKNSLRAGQTILDNGGNPKGLPRLLELYTPRVPPDKIPALREPWFGGRNGIFVKIGDTLSYVDLTLRWKNGIQNGSVYEIGRETAAWQVGRMAAGAGATFVVAWGTAVSAPPAAVLLLGAGGAYAASQGAQWIVRTAADGVRDGTVCFVTYLATSPSGAPPIAQPFTLGPDGFLMPMILHPTTMGIWPQLPITGSGYGGIIVPGQSGSSSCEGRCR